MNLCRGDVVRVQLDPTIGSEQRGERPALVISPDIINEYSPVVLVAAITSRKTERIYPFETLIEAPEAGLHKKSKILLMQLRSIDKRRIVGAIGKIEDSTQLRVNEALKIATGLDIVELRS